MTKMHFRLSKAALLVYVLSSISTAYKQCPEPQVVGDLDSVDALLQIDELVNKLLKSQCVCRNSCLNGGTRIDLFNGDYMCNCVCGFTGIICEIDLSITDETTADVTKTHATTADMSTTNTITMDETTTNVKTMDATITGSTGCRNYIESTEEYIGSQSQTFTNKPCQRWDSQIPHPHKHTDAGMYDGDITNISQAENYCRNPDDKSGGPWCFTTDPDKRWEYCHIPFCHGCRHTKMGWHYTGTMNQADCLRWEDANNTYTPGYFPGGIKNVSQAENYCRNPDSDDDGPWCYVNYQGGLARQNCHVPFCQGCQDGGYYEGTQGRTNVLYGVTCQRWDSQSPHPHNVTDPRMFKVSHKYKLKRLNEAENYCQIVDGVSRSKNKPWCYTMGTRSEWSYCDVPQCPI